MKNELYEKIEDAFVEESRLVERLRSFMCTYNDFEYDEMGMNMEEADEVKQRADKINNKLIANVSASIELPLDTMNIDTLHNTVELLVHTTKDIEKEGGEIETVNESIPFSIVIDEDGFTLEISEIDEIKVEDDEYSSTTDTDTV